MVISLGTWKGQLISGGSDGRLLKWSLHNGEKIQLGETTECPINQCIFMNEETICSGDAQGKLQIFKCQET